METQGGVTSPRSAAAPDAGTSPAGDERHSTIPSSLVSGGPVMIAALVFAVILVIADVVLSVLFFPRGGSWSPELVVLASAFWCAVVLAVGVGWWWWRRAPANPTGRLLFTAGACHGLWLIGFCWPYSSLAPVLSWSGTAAVLALALVVLGWPTGRPSRRLKTAVIAVIGCAIVISLVAGVFNRSTVPSAQWPDPPYALWSVPTVWFVLDPIQALAFNALPAVVTIVWLVRRRRAVPPAVRPLLTPITVAGVLAAGSITVVHVGLQLFPVPDDGGWDGGWVGTMFLVGLYFLPGWIAIGVLVAGNRRRRAVAVGRRRMLVDLRSATPIVTPSAAAAAIVGDSSATVRYLRPDGSWVDSSGSPLDGPAEDRRLLPVVDAAGEVVAGIDVDGSRTVPPLLADLAVSTVALRAANERAAALADSRRREVRARSRELVTATDRGRIDLERNLHDGAQQLLVGLALTVGLRARGSGPDTGARPAVSDIDEVVRQVRQIRHDVLTLVDSTTPAALTLGLVGALGSLAAVYPVSTTLESVGDLPADDPLALGLYLAAGEIVTNAVKHSTATRVDIGLTVGTDEVRLSVADNGIGGVPAVPAAVADRVRTFHGHAQIDSPVGGGTVVQIQVARSSAAGVPA
ncbi:MAG TPA: ATP-binding protein [Nakamurella sp.]|nr:ATP-binding protein [Nakamurella sp.]